MMSKTSADHLAGLVTMSDPQNAQILKDIVRESEAWAKGVFREATDLYKISGAMDPEMPTLLERLVGELGSLGSAPGVRDPFMMDLVNKNSSAPHVLEDFLRNVIEPEEMIKESRQKRSRSGGFTDGLKPEYDARRRAASFGDKMAPARSGSYSWKDPMFDITRGLKKVDPAGRSATPFLALTPQQRAAQGVFFEKDLPDLAESFKPQPRSMREAVLLGTRRGALKANTKAPNILERLKYEIASQNASRLAYKAQRSRIHGQYPGMFGVLEESAPSFKDKAGDMAAGLGNKWRRLPTPAKGLLGLGAGAAGLFGLGEYKRNQQAKRMRIQTAGSKAPAAEVLEDLEKDHA